MRKTPSSSSTTAWWWWRSVAILQGFAKHRGRGGVREVGLRQWGEVLVCWATPRPQVFIGGRGGGCAPSRVPSPGVAAAPRSHLGGGQKGRGGEAHLGFAPFPHFPAPWALWGGCTSPPGAGPLPHLAHAALWGRWPHLVDPRDPPGGPGTLPISPETFPVTKTGLPIYKSLPPDHSGTPRDVRDLIRDSEQHSVTTYYFP